MQNIMKCPVLYLLKADVHQVIHKQQKPLLFSQREHMPCPLKGHLVNTALQDNLCLFREIYGINKYTVWTKCTALIFSQIVHWLPLGFKRLNVAGRSKTFPNVTLRSEFYIPYSVSMSKEVT
jgi:hypothetical protein